jgi:hypothetical protein
MRAAIFSFLLALPLVTLVGCFEYDEPSCSFKCGLGSVDVCPEDYECKPDGYCHKQGSTDVCPFSDAAIVNDQSVPLDLGDDLTSVDSGPDL